MKTTTLTNSFHGTTYKTKRSRAYLDSIIEGIQRGNPTTAQKIFASRCKYSLCGIAGCACSNEIGERAYSA